eukprot:scaffold5_cov331-Pavlova_lutheri.AAC.41
MFLRDPSTSDEGPLLAPKTPARSASYGFFFSPRASHQARSFRRREGTCVSPFTLALRTGSVQRMATNSEPLSLGALDSTTWKTGVASLTTSATTTPTASTAAPLMAIPTASDSRKDGWSTSYPSTCSRSSPPSFPDALAVTIRRLHLLTPRFGRQGRQTHVLFAAMRVAIIVAIIVDSDTGASRRCRSTKSPTHPWGVRVRSEGFPFEGPGSNRGRRKANPGDGAPTSRTGVVWCCVGHNMGRPSWNETRSEGCICTDREGPHARLIVKGKLVPCFGPGRDGNCACICADQTP